MTKNQIKHMVNRFLGWRLPENFRPDAGISFKPTFNDHLDPPMRNNPTGTNLFNAVQAEEMVCHILAELPDSDPKELRATSDIKADIGGKVIDAADSIRKYVPDCQAIVSFQLDGMDFIAIVRDREPQP